MTHGGAPRTEAPRLDDLLAEAARRLATTSPTARLDARLLAAHALGVGTTWLVAHGRDALDTGQAARFEALVARRAAGEPVAYILGEREFWGRVFQVTPDTLIPRPETEHLVETALARLAHCCDARVLDIGTGSGCLAITLKLERPGWDIAACDISAQALRVASANGARLKANVQWFLSDLYGAVPARGFDLIVSNPPYIAATDSHLAQGDLRYEPPGALASGADGLDGLRGIVKSAPTYLAGGGWLILEHGWQQSDAVALLLEQAGLEEVFLVRDLAGHGRVSGARMPPSDA